MEIDQHLRDLIIKTAKDVECIRKELEVAEIMGKEHDQRIRKVEESQSFLAGKITILVMGIGLVMLVAANFMMKILR